LIDPPRLSSFIHPVDYQESDGNTCFSKEAASVGGPDLVRQIIAKRIIEVARKGERDPDELRARALQALGFRIRQIA
jgi:hypothetical protein